MLTIHTRALVDPLTVQKLSARLIFQLKFLIFNLNSLRSTLILYIHSIAAQVSRNCQRPPQKVTGSLDSTKLDYPGMFSTYIYYFQLKFVIFNLNSSFSTLIPCAHSITAQASRNCQRPPQKVTGSLDSTKLDYPCMFSTQIHYSQLKFKIFNLNSMLSDNSFL